MRRILLIRHAEKANPEDTGTTGGLSPQGEKEAQNLGKALRITGRKPDSIVHSSLLRAEQTARIIAEGARIDFNSYNDDRLKYPGKSSSEFGNYLKNLGGEQEMVSALVSTANKRPDQESWSSKELGEALWDLIMEKMKEGRDEDSNVHILISHSGMIENMEAFLKGTYDLVSLGGPINPLNGIEVKYEIDGRIIVQFRKVLEETFVELGFGELGPED